MKQRKIFFITILTIIAIVLPILSNIVLATQPAQLGQGGPGGGAPGENNSSSSVSYTGETEITTDTTTSNEEYSTAKSKTNAVLVSGGTSTLTNPTVEKSGDASDENSDFYGTNAAVLVYNGATLNIKNGTVTTNGGHANAVFAYGTGTINISDTTIKTSQNNSGGIMVTGGGKIIASNVKVTTEGNSSAAIRSDRGGGTIEVNGGAYTTDGIGSPAIYSTADITVNNATLKATSSEGAIIEGANKITLNKVTLTDTNTTLNGNSETYKNIFLYQSMSGDADVGTAVFTAKNSSITTNKGDTIYVTNTKAEINLENNKFVNNDGDFLRAEGAKWGNSGSNGGTVSLTATNQTIDGDIIIDKISTLEMVLNNGSKYSGTINADNTAKSIAITLDSNSTLTLTGDSYISELSNEKTDNSNINLNGYTLYVGEEEITETNYVETETVNSNTTTKITNITSNINTENAEIEEENEFNGNILICIIIILGLAAVVILIASATNKNK